MRVTFRATFSFSLCKMFDSEYSPNSYELLKKIGIGAKINLEMIRFIPDHFKTTKMCKHAVTIL